MKIKKPTLCFLLLAAIVPLSSYGVWGIAHAKPTNESPEPIVVGSITLPEHPIRDQGIKEHAHVQDAHQAGFTGQGVSVGILDESNFFLHPPPELDGRLRVISDDENTNILHGLTVAGILGASTFGIAPGVKIVAASYHKETTMMPLLYQNGIRITNHSYGSDIYPGEETPSDENDAKYFEQFVNQGGLLVWASHNNSENNPMYKAALPLLNAALKKGWLAVTAINTTDGSEGHAGEISRYANICGISKNWCLAAPGDFRLIPALGGQHMAGTSYATPVVTGTAALVQQAYPWMNGNLLRQTILSTANRSKNKDFNSPDAIYGWGIVDASKAVKGPALFDKRLTLKDEQGKDKNFEVNLDYPLSTFSNNITGDAGLIKNGTGTLILSGNNTYTGENFVNRGTLAITGSVASNVIIEKDGVLSGTGRVGDSVFSYGGILHNLADQNAAGKKQDGLTIDHHLTLDGDHLQNPSTLISQAGSTLTVNGTANINAANLMITDEESFISKQGKAYDVLTAKNIYGKFQNVYFKSPLIIGNTHYMPTKVIQTLERQDVTQLTKRELDNDPTHLASARNMEQVSQIADQMVNSGQTKGKNARFLTEATAFQRNTNTTLADSLDSLSGQIYASAQALTFQQSSATNRDLSNRLAQHLQNDNTSSVWMSGIGTSGKLRHTGYASANTALWGSQLGMDWAIHPQMIVGGAIAYSDGRAHFDRFGGTAKSHQSGLSLYGRYDHDQGNYLFGRLGAATVKSQVNREIMLGNTLQFGNAEHTDKVLSTYVEAGQAFNFLTPFVGISFDQVKRGAFSENSTSAFALKAQAKSSQKVATTLGLRSDYRFDGFGGKSTLKTYAAWQHALRKDSLNFEATYQGVENSHPEIKGIQLSKNSAWVGLVLTTNMNRRWGWFAHGNLQFEADGIKNYLVSAGINISLY